MLGREEMGREIQIQFIAGRGKIGFPGYR
jgi:hypothetical protein